MSPLLDSPAPATHSFPRVSGDEPVETGVKATSQAFSPRERG